MSNTPLTDALYERLLREHVNTDTAIPALTAFARHLEISHAALIAAADQVWRESSPEVPPSLGALEKLLTALFAAKEIK